MIVEDGKLVYRQSGLYIDTIDGSKWIFVLSTFRKLYVGKKKKGVFQHSSFLSGGATMAAGRLVAHGGVLEVHVFVFVFVFVSISAYVYNVYQKYRYTSICDFDH